MSDEITRKLPAIRRSIKTAELDIYRELERVTERAEVFGPDISRDFKNLLEKIGNIKIKYEREIA